MILMQILEQLKEFIQTFLIDPILNLSHNLIDTVADYTSSIMPPDNVLAFCGACINTFVPVSQIGLAIAIIVPAMIINLTVSLILRVKSFIPTMGD